MTAIRKSYLIAVEKEFGTGIPENDNEWWPVPQGFYLSHGSSTQANSMYGTGAKIRQNTIYGVFQGSWSASFVMDFNHLEFLSMLFDQDDNGNRSGVSTEEQRKEMFNFDTGKSGVYPSFLPLSFDGPTFSGRCYPAYSWAAPAVLRHQMASSRVLPGLRLPPP